MTEEDKRNERRKLLATWMNTIATAVVTVGTFIPIAQAVYGFMPIATDLGLVYGSAIICIGVGCTLHVVGQLVLGGLE